MKKGKIMKELRRVMTLALSLAMFVTQMPVTSLAAEPQETAILANAEDYVLQEDTSETETSLESVKGEKPAQEMTENEGKDNSTEASGSDAEETQPQIESSVGQETQPQIETESSIGQPESDAAKETQPQIETESSVEDEPETESFFAEADNAAADAQGFDIDSNNVLLKYTGTAEDVVIPDGVVTIGEQAFWFNNTIKTVKCPSTVTAIGDSAFGQCTALKSITLNEGLQKIGSSAFRGAPLGEISDKTGLAVGVLEIPSTVTEIGEEAFSGCKYLSEVNFNNNGTVILNMKPHSTGINYNTFSNCENLTKVTFPDRLEVIPTTAFWLCKKLESVTFGNKLAEIHDGAFGSCESLTELTFPASLKVIGAGAFSGCSKLKKVALNEGLEKIGVSTTGLAVITGAFQSCTSLTEVIFPNTVRTIGQSAYQQCSGLKKVVLNEGLWTIGGDAFSRSPLGENGAPSTLTIPSTVKEIGAGAFGGCENLGKAVFKNGEMQVLSIASAAISPTFGGCANLTAVILPDRLKKLEHETFSVNPKLKAVYIPPSVTEIGDLVVSASTCPNLTIYGESGSAAQRYANDNNIQFRAGKPEAVAVQAVKLTPTFIREIGGDVIGKTHQLKAEITPASADNQTVAYATSNASVANVNTASGLVTITGYGEATITVTTEDGGKTAACTVSVKGEYRPAINGMLFPGKKSTYSTTYTGYQIRPAMIVTCKYPEEGKPTEKTVTLKLNTDYTIEYKDNINVGTATVTAKGIGEYEGTLTAEFAITPKSIKDVTLSPVGDIVHKEGVDIASQVKAMVTDGVLELKRDEDYKIKLSPEGATSGVCKLSVEGIGNYKDTSNKSVGFNILQDNPNLKEINDDNVTISVNPSGKAYTYNGKPQKPAVTVKDKSGTKISASYYKVLYSNNVNAGTANVQVVGVSKKGKGYYGISEMKTFEIKPKNFSTVSVKVPSAIPKAGDMTDIKNVIARSIIVSDGKTILESGGNSPDYTIDYGAIDSMTDSKDIKIGFKYAITLNPVSGKNYTDTSSKTVYIKFGQLNLASKTANVIAEITDVRAKKINLSYNGNMLTPDTEYTVVKIQPDRNNTYTVTIKAVSNNSKTCAYKGSRTIKNVELKK